MNYSQHLVEQYLYHVFGKSTGYFLEIGCWDGKLISQTKWLEDTYNWFGLCVDPFPRNFKDRKCQVCSMAVSRNGQPREFVKVSIDRRDGGDVSYFSGFRDTIEHHWPLIEEHCDYETITVPTITPDLLWRAYHLPSYIEFLSIDVEGSELEILNAMDWTTNKFGMIVFEHNGVEVVKEKISSLLETNGYKKFTELAADDVYIRKELQ